MPYCHTTFDSVRSEQVNSLLSTFTRECFVDGQAAYKIDDKSFSIDAGENDIRAYYDDAQEVIKFFCRYESKMDFYDGKLVAFASKHGIETKPCNANSERIADE